MRRLFVSALALAAVALAPGESAALTKSAQSAAPELRWEDAFSVKDAPKNVHFAATYVDGKGRSHSLEVFRQGTERLVRKTDGRLALHVEKQADGDYGYRLIDHARAALIEVSRNNLFRIGVFTEWYGLAHVLAKPAGKHTLSRESGSVEKTPVGECRYIRIERPHAATQHVCWSNTWKLPLRILAEDNKGAKKEVFAIQSVEAKITDALVFHVDTVGLMQINADQDIAPND
jgi:hypothetical protein